MTETVPLADKAYAEIRRWLIRLELAPGSVVSETTLAEKLGIGKTPIREALHRLVAEGLMASRPRVGYEVSPVTVQDAHELFGLRLTLEPPVADTAASRLTTDQIEVLRNLSHVTYSEGDIDSLENFLAANREFHSVIAAQVGNSRLTKYVQQVLDESTRLNFFGLLKTDRGRAISAGHSELVDALESGDGGLARRVMEREIKEAYRLTLDLLMKDPVVLSAPLGMQSIRASS